MEIAKAYNPKEAESVHYDRWERLGCFRPETNQNPNAKKYSIVIPPPNVTGSLHMGHALQHTLMDVLVRRKRMQGYKTLWLPGTDHAGISVQRKVVEELRKTEGKTPQEIGREEFLKRAWAWKEKYGGEILQQMRREGASVDWTRFRFTLDESLSRAVREVFVRLYEEGWIYRGKRIVNWCPKDKTVLSDLEVKEEPDKNGKLYYLQYPVKESNEKITVATTRPETMLGDTGVAVNPNDERYKHLIGKTVLLPIANREIPIVADEYVDPEFGTGAVKITPAHDPYDYEIGLRHNLPPLLVMNEDATMNENAGADFVGLDRFEARKKVIEKFAELGLLEKIEDHETPLPTCERCKTVIEPFLSEQWFVKMDEMRDLALNLIKNENSPRFYPEVPHKKVYTNWLENIKDWTISRQLWWGHQIPAWYDKKGNVFVARSFEEAAEKAGTRDLVQDENVLDTWFSSALWAFSTFGWNGEVTETEDLNTFLPTDVLVTGRDIIFLWVSRMVMTTLKFVGKKPFEDVLVTGTVLGRDGKPMSKSRGNGVDPLDCFDKFGVDATRIYLAAIATGADIRWSDNLIETYRNFANKIWNAARFCLLNSEGATVDINSLEVNHDDSIADRWIISKLNKVTLKVNQALESYQFHEAVSTLYHFFWHDFCDWYIEFVKDEVSANSSSPDVIKARTRLITVLEQSLRLLHPFMPFLTEELWQKLPGISIELHNEAYRHLPEPTIMLADFPRGNEAMIDEKAEKEMQMVIELISKVRNIRAEMQIKPADRVTIYAATESPEVFKASEAQILKLARAESLILTERLDGIPKASARAVTADAEIAVPLEGLIDFDKERTRLENQLKKYEGEYNRLKQQLENKDFIEKAPVEKVQEVRSRIVELESQIKTLSQNIEALKA
ncbi:MAG: valine--tRNA ligase [Acidobacteria bacterium]|jgi:valyl-tRNA synthetase|nr:MAG: valine--tRNA ligase [Acidobacteriota bacterium]GIU82934.1 MAG: valine--tRNA ligase [Pyrinomonadaceae bacterium]